MNDLRLEFRTRNNRLWHVIFDTQPSVAAFCRVHDFRQSEIGRYLNLQANPYQDKGQGLRHVPQRLCDLSGLGRTELFPPDIYAELFPRKGVAEIESHRFVALAAAKRLVLPPSHELDIQQKQLRHCLLESLATLNTRERQVLEGRFGISGDEPKTLLDVAGELGVGRERIRQIEAKALRKLRHRSRANRLKPFIEHGLPVRQVS